MKYKKFLNKLKKINQSDKDRGFIYRFFKFIMGACIGITIIVAILGVFWGPLIAAIVFNDTDYLFLWLLCLLFFL